MSSDNQSSSFWTSMNGIVTAVAALLTAAAGLLVALFQVGVLGDDDSDPQQPAALASSTSTPSAPSSETSSAVPSPTEAVDPGDGHGAVLAGTWEGVAAGADDSGGFDVVLTIEPSCAMRQPCGTIYVSSAPCTGRVRLWSLDGTTYQFSVDRFTGDSSSDCTAGAGDFFELVDDDHVRYTTDYSDAVGMLVRS